MVGAQAMTAGTHVASKEIRGMSGMVEIRPKIGKTTDTTKTTPETRLIGAKLVDKVASLLEVFTTRGAQF